MENTKSKGLGDTIAKLTHATKLDKVAHIVASMLGKKDCGCTKRQNDLNTKFPYSK